MTYLKLKVRADAGRHEIRKKAADSYEIFVRQPAEQNRANREALTLLAEELGLPVGRLMIVKGAHAPAKIVGIR